MNPGMSQWKELIEQANQSAARQDMDKAVIQYKKALSCAVQLYPCWFNSRQSVNAVVVSHHNLSHVLVLQDSMAEAYDLLEKAHRFVCRGLQCNPEWGVRRAALLDAKMVTSRAINSFRRRRPPGVTLYTPG